jgi:hypothetical protein
MCSCGNDGSARRCRTIASVRACMHACVRCGMRYAVLCCRSAKRYSAGLRAGVVPAAAGSGRPGASRRSSACYGSPSPSAPSPHETAATHRFCSDRRCTTVTICRAPSRSRPAARRWLWRWLWRWRWLVCGRGRLAGCVRARLDQAGAAVPNRTSHAHTRRSTTHTTHNRRS